MLAVTATGSKSMCWRARSTGGRLLGFGNSGAIGAGVATERPADIERFVAGTEPHDDITLVALQAR